MRYPLELERVRHFKEVAIGTPLPPNMVIAQGISRRAQIAEAVHILNQRDEINQVVILAPPHQPSAAVLTQLRDQALGKRLMQTTSLRAPGIDLRSAVHQAFTSYARSRLTNLKAHDLLTTTSDADLDRMADYITASATDVDITPGAQLTKTVLSYNDHYHGSFTEAGFLNVHIDSERDHMDARMVDCVTGSGTVLFADGDFEYEYYEENGMLKTRLKTEGIIDSCWVLPPQSSVLMRTPPPDAKPSIRPAVHAHGLGQRGRSEERLTLRYDLTLG
ncbi:MAG: hypothetical protein NDJ24_01170 [Alphaproteobacteria bacterium]|nr:hypothetical protein [Alphaproteobacteria bacterium]